MRSRLLVAHPQLCDRLGRTAALLAIVCAQVVVSSCGKGPDPSAASTSGTRITALDSLAVLEDELLDLPFHRAVEERVPIAVEAQRMSQLANVAPSQLAGHVMRAVMFLDSLAIEVQAVRLADMRMVRAVIANTGRSDVSDLVLQLVDTGGRAERVSFHGISGGTSETLYQYAPLTAGPLSVRVLDITFEETAAERSRRLASTPSPH